MDNLATTLLVASKDEAEKADGVLAKAPEGWEEEGELGYEKDRDEKKKRIMQSRRTAQSRKLIFRPPLTISRKQRYLRPQHET